LGAWLPLWHPLIAHLVVRIGLMSVEKLGPDLGTFTLAEVGQLLASFTVMA
jgi:hypothetical protein